jgi:hypothetical protein
MIPGRIPNATRFLGAPQGWDEARDGHCGTLPVLDRSDPDDGHTMTSVWELMPDELERLKAGGSVRLTVVGSMHPPVSLEVGEPPK